MKKFVCIVLFAFSVLFFSPVGVGQNPDKIEKLLVKELKLKPGQVTLTDCAVPAKLEGKVNSIYQLSVDGQPDGWVLIANGMGRYDEFTFLVLTDKEQVTRMVRVINYISDHGGEISSKKWLDQFVGYKGGSLKYGEDIQAISGATYSASSVTHRMNEIMELFVQSSMK